MNGILYLVPSDLGSRDRKESMRMIFLSEYNLDIINTINEFIIEEERTARRYLKSIDYKKPFEQIKYYILNEHTKPEEYSNYLQSCKQGKDIGLLSEAGCPCIADPGASIVRIAHENNIRVIPLTGPSSIILALMASGFNGQNFSFHGYLPVDKKERNIKLKQIESNILKFNQTQIFIETPYRNNQLFEDIIKACSNETSLCIAVNLSLESERIVSQTISEWKNKKIELNKKPAVFLLYKF